MIGFSKYFSLLIQIVLVVAAVIALVVINPFNIFGNRKLTLTQTSTIVESIKSIGQLISAEYYGEVIQSSTENVVDSLQRLSDDMKKQLRSREKEFNLAAKQILARKPNLRRPADFWQEFIPYHDTLRHKPKFSKLFDLYLEDDNIQKIEAGREERDDIMFFLYERQRKKLPFELPQHLLDEFVGEEFALDRTETKIMERNRLVLLGRGWVKVGIDFGDLENGDLKYIESEGRILLMRHHPRIISATINPWFIPKEKVMGFEYILIGKNFRKQSDDRNQLELVQKLKLQCLQELEQQALKANIMATAKESAEQSLSSFFSLLLEKKISVKLFGHPLKAYLDEFSRGDNMISSREFISLDSLVSVYADSAFYQTVSFVKDVKAMGLQSLPPEIDTCDWSARAKYLVIAGDGIRTEAEEQQLTDSSSTLDRKSYLYFLLAKRPTLLDTIINRQAPTTLDTLASEVNKNPDLKNMYDKYRSVNHDALTTAVRKYTVVKKEH